MRTVSKDVKGEGRVFSLWVVLLVICVGSYCSGQIIATSHDLTPNGGLVREFPLFQGNLGW